MASRCRDELQFADLFLEALQADDTRTLEERHMGMLMQLGATMALPAAEAARVVEPVEGWDAFWARTWGDNTSFIEEWFDEGEELQHAHTLELEIDEPNHWERAVSWVREMITAARGRAA